MCNRQDVSNNDTCDEIYQKAADMNPDYMSRSSGSLFLLTYAEIRALTGSKLFFLLESAKKRTARKNW